MITTNTAWEEAQNWEQWWHSNCINSLNEEIKQLVYADKMGLARTPDNKTPYRFDLQNKKILDIGGGAYSLLLKCANIGEGSTVVDPLMDRHPEWVKMRYETLGVEPVAMTGEDVSFEGFDEVWIYNVLEHVYDPNKIAENARRAGKVVRVFEWIDTVQNIGHPQVLTEEKLNKWFGGEGKVEQLSSMGCFGKAWHGVFKGDSYASSSD